MHFCLATGEGSCYTFTRVRGTKGHTTAGVISSCLFSWEVTVKINGKVVKLNGPEPLVDVLISAGYDASGVALEINGALVKRGDMAKRMVHDEDVLEVFSFTGGG